MTKTGTWRYLAAILALGKFTISIPVALTAFLGYFLYLPVLDKEALLVTTGVLLLSMGSSAFNQIQERRTDAIMKRTEQRPIPAGIISMKHAIAFALLFLLLGSFLLLATRSLLATAIGLFTAGWYNLVYTPLKRITAFAVLPGALIGALPPIIGWTAAGGYVLDTNILIVAMFLFIGQMPHYWLLMVKVGEEFKRAGVPAITSILSIRQIRNISFVWIAAMAVMVFSFPAWSLIETKPLAWIMVSGAIVFLYIMFRIIFTGTLENDWKRAFITVNLFYLAIILALIADKILKTNNY